MREAGLEPARPKTQVPKTCVSAISPLPRERRSKDQISGTRARLRASTSSFKMDEYLLDAVPLAYCLHAFADVGTLRETIRKNYLEVCFGDYDRS